MGCPDTTGDAFTLGLGGVMTESLEDIGREHWDVRVCASKHCRKPINGRAEFIMQVSTKHVRWFCDVYCVLEGFKTHSERVRYSEPPMSLTWYEQAE